MAAEQQIDLFVESLINAPVKDERALMEFPFFSLTKQKRMEPFVYDDGKVRIEVLPGAHGMATIWDKDLLIYAASLINERIERGNEASAVLHISAHDFLKLTGRGTGIRAYQLMLDALDRLQSTQIKTTIEAGGERERRGFSWIDNYRVVERTDSRGRKVMAAVQISITPWMYRAIVRDRRVLTINRAYFDLTSGIARRLYELARKHCGQQGSWQIKLERLAEKCGSVREIRKFKADIKKLAEADSIPDYRMALVFDPADAEAKAAATEAFGSQAGKRYSRNEDILVVFAPR